jgi:GWxTD domain-containing protein
MTSRLAWLAPAALSLCLAASVTGSKPSLPITLDGVATPTAGDSARIDILAQLDSIPGRAAGPLIVSIHLQDEKGRSLGDKERVEPPPLEGSSRRILTWSFRSGVGKVRAKVRVRALDEDATGQADFDLVVPEFSREAFRVSTPWLGTLTGNSEGESWRSRFHPLPSHRIDGGSDSLAVLLIVGGRDSTRSVAPDSCLVRVHLRRDSHEVKDSTFVHPLAPGPSEVWIREDPRRWGRGKYQFQIVLSGPGGTVRREGVFQVAVGGADLLEDPNLVRTVLGYVATQEERTALETAPSDSLASLWTQFWRRRDPTPGTERNEALERFLSRVSDAIDRYGGVVPGWRSDRGRILIQHGSPDRMERVFDPDRRIETEIWYYDDHHTSYVFQDEEGFGNYRLTGGH